MQKKRLNTQYATIQYIDREIWKFTLFFEQTLHKCSYIQVFLD